MSQKITAIVLAAGQGKRMNSNVRKQFMLLKGKPVLYYSLQTIQKSFVDEIILVTGSGEEEYCRTQIVEKYGFNKVKQIVEGGKERYHSVYAGLCAAKNADYIFIHDGARPFLTEEILQRCQETVLKENACAAGVPVTDTVKIVDGQGYIINTPDRERLIAMQTPQSFAYPVIKQAYDCLITEEKDILEKGIKITDDAMVVEAFLKLPVKIVEGSYNNIKITTQRDLAVAEILCEK